MLYTHSSGMLSLILVALSASPAFGSVSGTVSDAYGKPVTEALVKFQYIADPSASFSAVTDANGRFQTDGVTQVNEDSRSTHGPESFLLQQNYPNPFNPSTLIPFTMNRAGYADLSIYNIQGQRVCTLIAGYLSAGSHRISWSGADEKGMSVGAGIYFYRLKAGSGVDTRKMLLLDGGSRVSSGSIHLMGGKPLAPGISKLSASQTVQVTITGKDIVSYTEKDAEIRDGQVYDFTVVRKVPDSTGITLLCIPGGTFTMGNVEGVMHSDPDTEIPLHEVTVSPFRMSEAEITNAQYCAFLNEELASGNITATDSGVTGAEGIFKGYKLIDLSGTWEKDYPDNRCWIVYSENSFHVAEGKENWPVVYVTWYGAKAFALHYGWDLPREAEWEYASRAGKQHMYGTDDGMINKKNANYNYVLPLFSYKFHPVDVKSYPPNPLGLYDLCGNAQEWCNDWYGTYPRGTVTDPTGPQTGNRRIVRGGSWFHFDQSCRSSSRDYTAPSDFTLFHQGFRVVSR